MSTSASAPPAAPRASADLISAAQGLTGVAALVLGLTYAIGASLRAGELREAGVDVREGMAVIPIEQLLTRGIDALIDPRNVLLFFALMVLGTFAAASRWVMEQQAQGLERRFAREDAEADSVIQARLQELAERDDPTSRQRLDEEKRMIEDIRRRRAEDMARFREDVARRPREAEVRVAVLAAVILVIVVLGFVPWVFAVSVVTGVVLLLGLVALMGRTGTLPGATAFFAGMLVVVAIAIAFEGQVNPREAVAVDLSLKEGAPGAIEHFGGRPGQTEVSGRLVALTDSAWYLSTRERSEADAMLTIQREDVEAGVTGSVDQRSDSVAEIVIEAIF